MNILYFFWKIKTRLRKLGFHNFYNQEVFSMRLNAHLNRKAHLRAESV